jgi:DNA-binding MarR family transcriptional regulator
MRGPHVDHSALQHLLGYALAQARVATNKAFFDAVGGPLQLRPVEFSLLMLLRDNDGVTQRQLATALNLNAPNLTTLLTRLQERGLLSRERSDSDRRAQLIRLTPEGLALATRARKVAATMESGIRKRYTTAEWALLLELLHRTGTASFAADPEAD